MHRAWWSRAGTLAGALALAACGGGGPGDSPSDGAAETATPSIPAALAEELARASDEVAASLEAGDGCGAAERTAELRASAVAAVEDGRVPAALERPLLAAVDRLAVRIVCEPVPEEDEEDDGDEADEDDDERPGKGKGRDKKDEEDDD